MNRKIYIVILSFISTFSFGQDTINLSENLNDNNIIIKGTYLSIDTSGLNLNVSSNPRAFFNENDQTVFGVEQKDVSIDNYESFIGKMLKFDTIFKESIVVFNEFTGKLIAGSTKIQNVDKDMWFCYLGNKDFVIEIKGFYNSDLKSIYKVPFEKVINSLFIDSNRKMSIYEDLPFYLDENKYPYKKEFSFMPLSISISRVYDGNLRSITMSYFKSNNKDIQELKEGYTNDVDKFIINGKEVITRTIEADGKITLKGIVIYQDQLINLTFIASDLDKEAIKEFKEIAKSITFK